MTTPTHHPNSPTHLRFEFDDGGAVVFATPFHDSGLAVGEHRLCYAQVYPGVRAAIVPYQSPVQHAERVARQLIEESGGYGS